MNSFVAALERSGCWVDKATEDKLGSAAVERLSDDVNAMLMVHISKIPSSATDAPDCEPLTPEF
jgi:hypothetical protein